MPWHEMVVYLGTKKVQEQRLHDAIKSLGARFTNSLLLTCMQYLSCACIGADGAAACVRHRANVIVVNNVLKPGLAARYQAMLLGGPKP